MSTSDITPDMLVEAIGNALEAEDPQAAVEILEVLSMIDLDRASQVLDSMQLGIALGGAGFQTAKIDRETRRG